MDEEKLKKSTTTNGAPPAPGYEHASAPGPIESASGQHTHYWVLNEEERRKGWVRPLRRSYVHRGPKGPEFPLVDIPAEEQARYVGFNYAKYEPYPESKRPLAGRYWTVDQLERVGRGCGTLTTMGLALCETYARDPKYYGSTFCAGCGKHLPVEEFTWDEDGEVVGS